MSKDAWLRSVSANTLAAANLLSLSLLVAPLWFSLPDRFNAASPRLAILVFLLYWGVGEVRRGVAPPRCRVEIWLFAGLRLHHRR